MALINVNPATFDQASGTFAQCEARVAEILSDFQSRAQCEGNAFGHQNADSNYQEVYSQTLQTLQTLHEAMETYVKGLQTIKAAYTQEDTALADSFH